jgi:hypothetical protein
MTKMSSGSKVRRDRVQGAELLKISRGRRIVCAAAAGLSLVMALAPVAEADVLCANTGGTICCGSQTWLPIFNVAVSYWTGDAGKHYYARRQDSSGTLTYNQYVYNGGNWNFDNGTDVPRGTGMYRGEQPLMNFAESESSHTHC